MVQRPLQPKLRLRPTSVVAIRHIDPSKINDDKLTDKQRKVSFLAIVSSGVDRESVPQSLVTFKGLKIVAETCCNPEKRFLG